MNYFLHNGSSSKKKNIRLRTANSLFSKNHLNIKKSLFKTNNKLPYFSSKVPSDSVKEISRHKLSNKISSKASLNERLNDLLAKAIETEMKYKINQPTIKSESNLLIPKNKSNKSLNNITNIIMDDEKDDEEIKKSKIKSRKRNSVFIKDNSSLRETYGIISKSERMYLNDPSMHETFFTSIPIESKTIKKPVTSKKSSITSLLDIVPQLKSKTNYFNIIHLKELKNQIFNFETSKNFDPNEKKIAEYLSTPERFSSKKYTNKIDFRKKIKINQEIRPKISMKRTMLTTPNNIKSNVSKCLYKIMNNLQTKSEKYSKSANVIKHNYKYDMTDRVLRNVLDGSDLWNADLDNYIKGITMDYKRKIGDFTFYRGKGIFSNHLRNLMKNERKIAFMLTNQLVEK
jgi:hypothetical protein